MMTKVMSLLEWLMLVKWVELQALVEVLVAPSLSAHLLQIEERNLSHLHEIQNPILLFR
ncbi:hypothetical protein Scep_030644 [Stephania cephalantha]|uniref:Uncharacterized protein n=1 Tax=Stephania cephalantha TaxID=152367 RepID=A0AAP0E7U2_9MAGN